MGQDSAMTAVNLPLHDIHLPTPVSWWPPAPGWWILGGLLLVMAIFVWGLSRFRKRRKLQRLALQQLEELTGLPETELLVALSRLLRQAAISHFAQQDCAGLSGQEWLKFLDRPFYDHPFSAGIGSCLSDAPYRPEMQIDTAALVNLCRNWLKKLPPQSFSHRREK
ncbi:MAG: DUF4381 domain-containing protein [Desulfuromusa sp.]